MASDYTDIGLGDNLESTTGPVSEGTTITGYQVSSTFDRNSIGNTQIQNFNFAKGQGGTLTLGGTNNGKGLMVVNDSFGTPAVQIDNGGVLLFGTSSLQCVILDTSGSVPVISSPIAFFGPKYSGGTTGTIVLQTMIGVPMNFSLNGGGVFQMGANSQYPLTINGTTIINGSGTINGNLIVTGTSNISSGTISSGTADYAKYAGTAGYVVGAGALQDAFNGSLILGYISGGQINFFEGGVNKTAIVPTSQGFNSLYCTESPEVWFMDFCESKDNIDPMFLEVTSPPYHFIKCEDGEYQVWGKRKGHENKRFESNSEEDFINNNQFWATPKIKSLSQELEKSISSIKNKLKTVDENKKRDSINLPDKESGTNVI